MPAGIYHEIGERPVPDGAHCGQCREFCEDGPVKGHGWCTHLMVVVDFDGVYTARQCLEAGDFKPLRNNGDDSDSDV